MLRCARALVVMLLVLTWTVGAAVPARAGAAGDLVSMVNAERRERGLRTLDVRDDLAAVARRHAARMASRGRLYHNPNLGSEVDGWSKIGENVGRGGGARQIHRLFMGSSSHRSVILEPAFNQIGVGVAWRGDVMYVSEVFVKRGSGGTSKEVRSSSETRSTSTTEPRAAPRVSRSSRQAPRARPAPVVVPEIRTVDLLLQMMAADAGG